MSRAFCSLIKFAVSFTFSVLLCACETLSTTSASVPPAQQGVLDARTWDWQQPRTIDLDGEWEFYWNQLLLPSSSDTFPTASTLLTLPSVWNGADVNGLSLPGNGCATYRLRVLLPPSQELLGLRTGNVSTAMNLYIDGQEVYQVGTVGCQREDAKPQYANDYVIFRPAEDTLNIVLQVANFYNREGGLWSTMSIGTEQNIRRAWRNDIAIDFFLIGTILIIAIYHLILFLFRRGDRSPLYFSLFCFAVIIRIATVDNYVVNFFFTLRWAWLVRLEYLSFYLGAPMFVSFFYHLFPSVVPVWFVRISWVIASLFSFIVLVLPPQLFAYTTVAYQCVVAAITLHIIYLMIVANLRRYPGSRAFALGFVAISLAFAHDVLAGNGIIHSVFLFSFGLFVFIFFQTFLLSKRFSLAFNAVEEANNALSFKNEIINERNEELKQLNNELDVFVYRASHDLRAPISSMMGLINIMRTEKDTNQFTTYLNHQEKSLLKLDNFIQDILNYSRNSRLEISPEPANFREIIDEIFSLHSHLPDFVRIDKRIEIHQDVPFTTDVKRLTIVLNNLISNAIRYCNLQQDHPYVSVTVDASPSFAQITVADNGIGIADEHLDKVFDMFYRASTESRGSGLGLFIAKEMVQKLKGTVQVRSQAHEGSVFVLTVPNLRSVTD